MLLRVAGLARRRGCARCEDGTPGASIRAVGAIDDSATQMAIMVAKPGALATNSGEGVREDLLSSLPFVATAVGYAESKWNAFFSAFFALELCGY